MQTLASSIHSKALDLTRLTVEMTAEAGSGHPTSASSLAHLVTVLMYAHMRYAPENPDDPNADRLVLSEGHACPIVYAAGVDLGLPIQENDRRRPMTRGDAMRLRRIDSSVDGHPNPAEGFPFFPAATGSLGQGLSVAAGLGLAAELDSTESHIFCILGDGESREGQVWEALDFIVDHGLRRVCPIFNCNGYGQTSSVSPQQSPEVIRRRLEAAGYEALMIDGHEPTEIEAALAKHAASTQQRTPPVAIVARTEKGWAIPSAAGRNLHGSAVTGEDKREALSRIEEQIREMREKGETPNFSIPAPSHAARVPSPARTPPRFDEAIERFGLQEEISNGNLATRKAYGIALRALGHADPQVVALDADVSNSTHSWRFAEDPALRDRFFECRIGEQNMLSCGVGLAASGKKPFVSSFGKFLARAYDQVEMAVISRANVKLVGSHAGVSLAADGPSQMALPDVAYFRSFTSLLNDAGEPLLRLLQPADAYATYALTMKMAEHEGPAYMRTMRPDVPLLYDNDTEFTMDGYHVLSEGRDLLIAASGYMVHECTRVLPMLRDAGFSPTLVDIYALPFDRERLCELVRLNMGKVLTVEDNYGGGLGAALAETLVTLGQPCRMRQIHVRKIPKSGRTPDEVLAYLALSAPDIASAALELLAQGQTLESE